VVNQLRMLSKDEEKENGEKEETENGDERKEKEK
jgi:hypothetical protein